MSDPLLIQEDYIVVVDTDCFAGSFADLFCAYVTGFYGEEASGEVRSMSDVFYRDHDIEDDAGPKGFLAEDKNPFHGYVTDHQDEYGNYTPVAVWPSRRYGVNPAGDYARLTEDNFEDYNFPAGFSVGIFFAELPPADLLGKIKERGKKFFSEIYPNLPKKGKQVTIEGFRLITHRKTAEEQAI